MTRSTVRESVAYALNNARLGCGGLGSLGGTRPRRSRSLRSRPRHHRLGAPCGRISGRLGATLRDALVCVPVQRTAAETGLGERVTCSPACRTPASSRSCGCGSDGRGNGKGGSSWRGGASLSERSMPDAAIETVFHCDALHRGQSGTRPDTSSRQGRHVELVATSADAFRKMSYRQGPDGVLGVAASSVLGLDHLGDHEQRPLAGGGRNREARQPRGDAAIGGRRWCRHPRRRSERRTCSTQT